MKKSVVAILIGLSLVLVGCSGKTSEPERPLADIKKGMSAENKVDNSVYPTMALTVSGVKKDFKLKSQVVKYLDNDRKNAEIYLGDTKELTCKQLNPSVKDGEMVVVIKVKGNEKIGKMEYPGEGGKTEGEIRDAKGTQRFGEEGGKVMVSDINDQVLRGKLAVEAQGVSLSGDFFGAVCKE